MSRRPLRSLHSGESLSRPKLVGFGKLTTDELIDSLRPGQPGALKARPDGTIMEATIASTFSGSVAWMSTVSRERP